jgi:hypothetical protein
MIDALAGVIVIPAAAAVLLPALPGYWLTARLNVFAAPIYWWTISTRYSSS